nr:MAG TPA: hypothetical protein [Caudoviricetes sp.]
MENPFLFFYISFLSGEGVIRKMYLCCVYVTIQSRGREKQKIHAPVVRSGKARDTVDGRTACFPGRGKNAASDMAEGGRACSKRIDRERA